MTNTLLFALGSVFVQLPISLALALLLNQGFLRLRNLFRFAFFSPYLLGQVFAAVLFGVIFAPQYGLLNRGLDFLLPRALQTLTGLTIETAWLSKPGLVMPALILTALWMYAGFNMVYFLAALQAVDRELYDAAAVDGANVLQRFWNVTVPGIKPVVVFVVVLCVIGSFQLFELPWFMLGSSAGPEQAGLTIVMYLYQRGFVAGDLGYASAVGWVLALGMLLISVLQLRLGGMRGERTMKRRRTFSTRVFIYVSLLAATAIGSMPLFWLIAAVFKDSEDFFHYLFFPPLGQMTLHNFVQLFREQPFARYLANSLFLTGTAVLVQVFFASLGGFALAKYDFKGKRLITLAMLGLMTIPGQVMLAPTYELIYKMGLIDTYAGLILPGMVSVFGMFLFRQAIARRPRRAARRGPHRRRERVRSLLEHHASRDSADDRRFLPHLVHGAVEQLHLAAAHLPVAATLHLAHRDQPDAGALPHRVWPHHGRHAAFDLAGDGALSDSAEGVHQRAHFGSGEGLRRLPLLLARRRLAAAHVAIINAAAPPKPRPSSAIRQPQPELEAGAGSLEPMLDASAPIGRSVWARGWATIAARIRRSIGTAVSGRPAVHSDRLGVIAAGTRVTDAVAIGVLLARIVDAGAVVIAVDDAVTVDVAGHGDGEVVPALTRSTNGSPRVNLLRCAPRSRML